MFDARVTFKPAVLGDVLAMRPGRSVAGVVRSHIPDPRVSQMVDHFTQYVGSAPAASPAVLCGIAHMQTGEGVWYPKGGTRAIPEALATLAESLGVEFRRNAGVKKIVTASGRIRGLSLENGGEIEVDAVISNCDSVRTYRELLGGAASSAFDKRRRYEPACSGVVLYLGLKRRYNHLLHHNFVFSQEPDVEFRAIYEKGQPAPDPTCYVCAPSATDPTVAPAGGEALYVLVHTPYLRPNHDWAKMLPHYRRVILEKLKAHRGAERHRIADRLRTDINTGGSPPALPCPQWSNLWACESRPLSRRVQTGESESGCAWTLSCRWVRASRSRYANGPHVGVDRRRHSG